MKTTGIIILAAGASQRLGTPKQQLLFQNKSLLQNVVHTAQQTGGSPVIVVLGAYATQISQQLITEEVTVTVNPNWPVGMAGSIKTGLQQLLRIAPHVSSAFLLTCDQPFINPALLQNMHALKTTSGKGIVACSYNNTIGTPVLFDKTYFPLLQLLSGQEGAKIILQQHPHHVATLDFPQGAIDIDTSSDYERLLTDS
ncbi:molybdenum cofactor cytidylyltransferase [Chitinophaga niastensis]|uniref:Molybdenum cofactor cytidylyltransferase n=1 Tax=Chitinophaga niastensis TaxID=536980 RepID=A0A2P8HNP8_CHINA|nr:nucleotidyltransferase family protein [Chitinophaga niastensis]PSL47797.1 molybdenum cofactor cytidylyltransferase [Chitinophaga niastensis]